MNSLVLRACTPVAVPLQAPSPFIQLCVDFIGQGYVRIGHTQWNDFKNRFLEASKNDPAGVRQALRMLDGGGTDHILLGWQLIELAKAQPHLLGASEILPLLTQKNHDGLSRLLMLGFVEVLGVLPDNSSTPRLLELLGKSSRSMARTALLSLVKSGDPAQMARHLATHTAKGDLARALGLKSYAPAFPFLRDIYAGATPDDRASILEAMGTITHPDAHGFILQQLRSDAGGLSSQATSAALQSLGTAVRHFDEVFAVLTRKLQDEAAPLTDRASALFASLFIARRYGLDFLPAALRSAQDRFYASSSKDTFQLSGIGSTMLRPSFGSLEELRAFVDQDHELAFCIIPTPEDWNLPTHDSEFMIKPSDADLELTRYTGSGGLAGREWPAMGQDTEAYLRSIGLIGGSGVVLIMRGDSEGIMLPPIFSKLGFLGHSHISKTIRGESENDQVTFVQHELALTTLRRFL